MTNEVIIFDIDGTLSDCRTRLYLLAGADKDYDTFYEEAAEDSPVKLTLEMLQDFICHGRHVVLMTGRPEKYREITEKWLADNTSEMPELDLPLYMRKEGDYRPSAVVKEEWLNEIKNEGYTPILAVEDDQSVVDMWQRHGIMVLQVKL